MPRYGVFRKYGKSKSRGRKRTKRRLRRGRKGKYNKVYSKKQLSLPTIVPDRSYIKFKYTTYVNQVIGAGSYYQSVYRGNSLYDPDFQVGGRQPLGYNIWSQFYNKYCVHGAKVRVSITNIGAGTNAYVVVVPETTPSVPFTNITELTMYPYSRHCVASQATGMDRSKVKHYMSTKKIWGVHKAAVLADQNYASLTSNNPVNTWYWNIFVDTPDAAKATNVQLKIDIVYYAEMYERYVPSITDTADETDTWNPVKTE